MSNLTTQVAAFFGDTTRQFKLTAPMIIELERTTGAGIGGLCKRLFANDFKFYEIAEVIRLALIGGGEPPDSAKSLVAAYVHGLPISYSLPVAITIFEALFFGVEPPRTEEVA